MGKDPVFFICPVCFKICETERQCHDHLMMRCDAGKPGSELRKPVTDRFGNMVSSAPRWYLEARRIIPSYTPSSAH